MPPARSSRRCIDLALGPKGKSLLESKNIRRVSDTQRRSYTTLPIQRQSLIAAAGLNLSKKGFPEVFRSNLFALLSRRIIHCSEILSPPTKSRLRRRFVETIP